MDVVVGASGHLGNVLTSELVSRGGDVRPIFRSPPRFDLPRGVEPYFCNLDDIDTLVEAFRGADTVYHAAGAIAIGLNAYKKLYHANVVITKNIIAACLNAGVRRLVYTGTIEAFDLLSAPRRSYQWLRPARQRNQTHRKGSRVSYRGGNPPPCLSWVRF